LNSSKVESKADASEVDIENQEIDAMDINVSEKKQATKKSEE
jgi:hypothetical protein